MAMKLPDGRYRCPACTNPHDREQMHSDLVYCLPCFRSKAREAYALRMALKGAGLRPRPRGSRPPEDFAAQAKGRTDEALAGLYAVSDKTIAKWRAVLAIPPNKSAMPDGFASQAKGMTGREVAERWRVCLGTAYKWLRQVDDGRKARAKPVPADWAQQCQRMGLLAIARHYGCNSKTAARWARITGIAPLSREARGRLRAGPIAPRARPELPSARTPEPVYVHTNGCKDCTSKQLCRAHQTAQLNSDIEAWLAAGNAPREVPQGATGMTWGYTRPTA
jgi:hypothetical protein